MHTQRFCERSAFTTTTKRLRSRFPPFRQLVYDSTWFAPLIHLSTELLYTASDRSISLVTHHHDGVGDRDPTIARDIIDRCGP